MDASGEVAELKDNINQMMASLRETTRANQEQDWLKTNLARISGLMQGHRDLAVVAELIMDELTPLVAAQYGAFFLAEEAPRRAPSCGSSARYGYPADPAGPTRVPARRVPGRPGRAERRTIPVDDVPGRTTSRISSRPGRARARRAWWCCRCCSRARCSA